MAHAQEVYNNAKHTLTYFSFQKQRLEDLMSQMAERLRAVEGSLSDLTDATSPEDIAAVKVRRCHFCQQASQETEFKSSLGNDCISMQFLHA